MNSKSTPNIKPRKSLEKSMNYARMSKKNYQAPIIQTTNGVKYKCIYCKVEFPCEGSIYVHLTTIKHLGLPNAKFQAEPTYECNICGSDLAMGSLTKHSCVEKAYINYWTILKHIDEYGSPNMCLLCRGMLFETPAHLNTHMFICHSWKDFNKDQKANDGNIDGLVCPLCMALFKTKDVNLLHLHAFADHVADVGIPLLITFSGFRRAKYGSDNDIKQWLTKQLFSCNFSNSSIKKFPMTKSQNINRSLPEFNQKSCNETFSSLINLTSHLCCNHFLDGIKTGETRLSITSPIKKEIEIRKNMIQKELDLRWRTLLERNVITNSIKASHYCIECFKLYQNSFDIQIHYMVSHSNFNWNVCGLCGYDCKFSLSLTNDNEAKPERTYTFLWNALWIHEQCHIRFFNELAKNPTMDIPDNLLISFPDDLIAVLKPFEKFEPEKDYDLTNLDIPKSILTPKQNAYFRFLGKQNKAEQTELIINESIHNFV